MGEGTGKEVAGDRRGPSLGQKTYAERLGVSHNVFRLAYALAMAEDLDKAAAERREFSSSAFRMPLVRETARRIAPPSRRVGRSPEWDLVDVERFEQGLRDGGVAIEPAPPRRPRGRSRRPDPVLASFSRHQLERALARADLGETARKVFAARYGLGTGPGNSGREDPGANPAPTTHRLAGQLGISHQGVSDALSRAERKVKQVLLENRQGRG